MSSNPRLRDLLLLTRAPLAFTAVSDALAGALIADAVAVPADRSILASPGRLALVAGSSACAYLAGMTLNDYFDRDRDRALAPHRPIPAGRVTASAALKLAIALSLFAAAAAAALGIRALIAHAVLMSAILSYDAYLKNFRILGAGAMGACRALNILFAGLAALSLAPRPPGLQNPQLPAALLAFAGASFLYIFALTWLSTYEDEEAPRWTSLSAGLLLFAAPAALFAINEAPQGSALIGAHAAAGVLALLIALRLAIGHQDGSVRSGRATTKWLIRGTYLLAAAGLVLAERPRAAIALPALIIPATIAAAWLFKKPPVLSESERLSEAVLQAEKTA